MAHITDDYQAYSQAIIDVLNHEVDANKLDIVDFLRISYELTSAQTSEHLMSTIHYLEEEYPFLTEVDFEYRKELSQEKDVLIQMYATELIKQDKPKEAEEFTKFASDTTVTLEGVMSKFPAFADFVNSK